MTDETITNEFLCVLNEVGFDMTYVKKNPHEIIKTHSVTEE